MVFFYFFRWFRKIKAVYVTREELDKILLSKIEPIENSLNFNGDEFKKLLCRVETLEKTVKALRLENQALKSQINSVHTKMKEHSFLFALFMHDCYIKIDFQVLSIISLKAFIKFINMQSDWPLRRLIIYRKLGRIMENLTSVSVGLNSGMLLKKS